MADRPAALQLRLLRTVVEVAAEKNSTLVLPFPVGLLTATIRVPRVGGHDALRAEWCSPTARRRTWAGYRSPTTLAVSNSTAHRGSALPAESVASEMASTVGTALAAFVRNPS